ncbi:MAG: YdbL family protein [Candidatus Omnitrophica bacterium]|nr:YdbL family protein [Candidatus Omnitrophota bacterium]
MKIKKIVSPFLFLILMFTCASSASAAQYDIKEMTPAVQNAISGRQGRYSDIQSLKSSGVLGENNRGYVEVRNPSGNAGMTAEAENRDRKTIYQTIAEQNNLGRAGVETIETIFAEVIRGKAQSGDSVQLPSGEWTKK